MFNQNIISNEFDLNWSTMFSYINYKNFLWKSQKNLKGLFFHFQKFCKGDLTAELYAKKVTALDEETKVR